MHLQRVICNDYYIKTCKATVMKLLITNMKNKVIVIFYGIIHNLYKYPVYLFYFFFIQRKEKQ